MRIPAAPAYITTRAPILGPLPAWRETVYPVRGLEHATRIADRMREGGYPRVRVLTGRPPARGYLVQEVATIPKALTGEPWENHKLH